MLGKGGWTGVDYNGRNASHTSSSDGILWNLVGLSVLATVTSVCFFFKGRGLELTYTQKHNYTNTQNKITLAIGSRRWRAQVYGVPSVDPT